MPVAHSTPAAVRAEKDQRVKTILKFGNAIPQRLAAGPSADRSIAAELLSYLPTFPLKPAPNQRAECDAQGTELWNLSTRLNRSKEPGDNRIICLLRVFAFFLLDSSNHGKEATWSNCIRILKVATRASKTCIENPDFVWGTKVLERMAYYIEQLEKYKGKLIHEDLAVQNRLGMEYLVLRILLAWKQSKLEVAEHMYRKLDNSQLSADPAAAEELVDALYEIGKDQYAKKQIEVAVRWLGRAHDVLSEQELERLSDTSTDLRLSTMHLLTKSHLALDTPESVAKAQDLVELMEADYGDKLLVSLLRLEILSTQAQPDADVYYGVLLRMFRSIILTKSNFKTVMHHLHKLRKFSPDLACKALDDLLHLRLFESEKEEWVEKAAMMRIWITTSSPVEGSRPLLDSLGDFLDDVSNNTKVSFTPAATHAAQTLIWKVIETNYEQKCFESTEKLCRLSSHPLFDKCGEGNKAKLVRKIIQSALARQDFVCAREAFFSMSEAGQASPQSRFLLYKVALRTGDNELASECLDVVCQSSSKDATLLYACVLEAQQVGHKGQAVVALQKVLDKYQYSAPDGVHLPALLRSTARLMKGEMDLTKPLDSDVIESFCRLFEGAAAQAHRSKSPKSTASNFDQSEFEWFSRNSYNLALEICADANPVHLVRLTSACIQFIEMLMPGAEGEKADDLRLRHILCEYLSLAASIVLARAEDSIGISCQHYLAVRKHSQVLRQLVPLQLETNVYGEGAAADLKSKHVEAVKYELEAIIRLQNWDDLDVLLEECWKYDDVEQWETFADLGFVINEEVVKAGLKTAHQAKVLAFIQKIINYSFKFTSDITNVARWLRCLFRISITFDEKIALQCIGHAISMAQRVKSSSMPFPSVELEFFATTTFNHAIDLFVASDDAACKHWVERALTLAALVGDQEELLGLMKGRYSELVWGEGDLQ